MKEIHAELHALSNFSFLRGASHPQELVRQARALGYSALAITDECSLAGIVRAWEAAKEVGLKLIVGGEFRIADNLKLVLLAPDAEGYAQLCALMTLGRRRSVKGRYGLSVTDLCNDLDRLLTLWIPEWPEQGLPESQFAEALETLVPLFQGRLWIAWERHLHPQDRKRLALLRRLGQRYGLPLVAAGDVRYHVRERQALHDVLSCIRAHCTIHDADTPIFPNGERHLRPLSVLSRLYPADLLRETQAIAERCTFSLEQLHYEYPHELVPEGIRAIEHLRRLTEAGSKKRWPGGATPEVKNLIKRELKLIEELRYEHFFLTVEDMVRFARSRGILCQGRGSAANSAVCYALGVTEVDPARMNLLFERFISKERAEPPDIDIDFEHQRREEVIQYVYGKYGRERAALAATVICYRRRMAVRDVGKALGLSAEQVDAISKSLAWWDGNTELIQRLTAMGMSVDGQQLLTLVQRVNEIVGFRLISGMPEAEAQRLIEARKQRPFSSVQDLTRRACLSKRALNALAESGALASLAGHRHAARWTAAGVQRLDGILVESAVDEDPLPLPPPTEGQSIIADYQSLGLTLGRHPLALLRHKLSKLRILCADQLRQVANGRTVRVAGIVTHRQRPETASGVVFATLEDETGTANLIIWPKILETQREAVLGAMLMVVSGELQSEQGVIHVVAREVRDYSPWLGSLRTDSRDFH